MPVAIACPGCGGCVPLPGCGGAGDHAPPGGVEAGGRSCPGA